MAPTSAIVAPMESQGARRRERKRWDLIEPIIPEQVGDGAQTLWGRAELGRRKNHEALVPQWVHGSMRKQVWNPWEAATNFFLSRGKKR